MDFLTQLDSDLLLWLNGHHNEFTDNLMWLLTGRYIWIPLYLLMAFAVESRYGWRSCLLIVVFIGMAVGISDYVCASVIRPAVERMRPSNPDNPISSMVHVVNDYRGGRYGFPSCHAANTFSLALFFALVMRRRWITVSIMLWSLIVCYTRIHLGVHYPGDILCGMALGALFTLVMYSLLAMLVMRIRSARESGRCLSPISFMSWMRLR